MATEVGWLSTVAGSTLEKVNEDNPLPTQVVMPTVRTFSFKAAGTTADAVVANPTPCKLIGWSLTNHAATERLVRVYDLGRPPVALTDGGSIKLRLSLPATATGTITSEMLPQPGSQCFFGLAFTISTVVTSDTDTTAPTAGDVLLNLFFA